MKHSWANRVRLYSLILQESQPFCSGHFITHTFQAPGICEKLESTLHEIYQQLFKLRSLEVFLSNEFMFGMLHLRLMSFLQREERVILGSLWGYTSKDATYTIVKIFFLRSYPAPQLVLPMNTT